MTIQGFWKGAQAEPNRVALVDIDGREITAGELLFGLAKRPQATNLHGAVREFLRREPLLEGLPDFGRWRLSRAVCHHAYVAAHAGGYGVHAGHGLSGRKTRIAQNAE